MEVLNILGVFFIKQVENCFCEYKKSNSNFSIIEGD
jgi:DNA-dependent RNA polymerase auxiliary subunit epsilon